MDRYSTIVLKQINNVDSFLKMVDRCSYPVYVCDQAEDIDLKNNETVRNFMRTACAEGCRGMLNLKVCLSDAQSVMSYMM